MAREALRIPAACKMDSSACVQRIAAFTGCNVLLLGVHASAGELELASRTRVCFYGAAPCTTQPTCFHGDAALAAAVAQGPCVAALCRADGTYSSMVSLTHAGTAACSVHRLQHELVMWLLKDSAPEIVQQQFSTGECACGRADLVSA